MTATDRALSAAHFCLNVLDSVPGRDKVFKIVQYSYSLLAYHKGFHEVDFGVRTDDASYSRYERNAMSIQNTRRLFKIARFIGEWERIQTALSRCNELVYYAEQSASMVLFVQAQMLLDITARLLGCVKSFLDDVLYFSRIGVLNSTIHRPLERLCPQISLPVIGIDIFLNGLKLLQFIDNASSGHRVRHRKSFSLLARYEINEKRRLASSMLPAMLSPGVRTAQDWAAGGALPLLRFAKDACTPPMRALQRLSEGEVSPLCLEEELGDSKAARLWDFLGRVWRRVAEIARISYWNREIFWSWVTLIKLLIDLTVTLSYARPVKWLHRGHITSLAIVSGVLNVCKIGNNA